MAATGCGLGACRLGVVVKDNTWLLLIGGAILLYGWNAGWFSGLTSSTTAASTAVTGPCPAGYLYSYSDQASIYCDPGMPNGTVITVPNLGVL
jgi:hypothetical protein